MAAGSRRPPDRDGSSHSSQRPTGAATSPNVSTASSRHSWLPAAFNFVPEKPFGSARHPRGGFEPTSPPMTTAPPPPPPTRRDHKVELTLFDLDMEKEDIRLRVRPGAASVAKVDEVVRRYLMSMKQISDDQALWFYGGGVELVAEDLIDTKRSLHYRVGPASELKPVSRLRISFETYIPKKKMLFAALEQELMADILEGKTVGEVRDKFAQRMDIVDPNTVYLVARGGLRPGPLYGSGWQVKGVKDWLCQHIKFEICADHCYIVLRGYGREYVYHPNVPNWDGVTCRDLKEWQQKKLFTYVHSRDPFRHCNVDIKNEDIRLTKRGKRCRRSTLLPWGSVVEFEIPTSSERAFAEDEAWLYAPAATCEVCGEDKRQPEMPHHTTKGCTHMATTCRECLGMWIQSSMGTTEWDRLRCPNCPELLSFQDVKMWAPDPVFARYVLSLLFHNCRGFPM
jgi:hypothetical protein